MADYREGTFGASSRREVEADSDRHRSHNRSNRTCTDNKNRGEPRLVVKDRLPAGGNRGDSNPDEDTCSEQAEQPNVPRCSFSWFQPLIADDVCGDSNSMQPKIVEMKSANSASKCNAGSIAGMQIEDHSQSVHRPVPTINRSPTRINHPPQIHPDLPLLGGVDMYYSHASRNRPQELGLRTSMPLYVRMGTYSNTYGNLTAEYIRNPCKYMANTSSVVLDALLTDVGLKYNPSAKELQKFRNSQHMQLKTIEGSSVMQDSCNGNRQEKTVQDTKRDEKIFYPQMDTVQDAQNATVNNGRVEKSNGQTKYMADVSTETESFRSHESSMKDSIPAHADRNPWIATKGAGPAYPRKLVSAAMSTMSSFYQDSFHSLNESSTSPSAPEHTATSTKHEQVLLRRMRMERNWMNSEKRIEMAYGKRAALDYREKVRNLEMAGIRKKRH